MEAPIPLSISSKKKYCYLDPLAVLSQFLVTTSGDNCHKARPPRHSAPLWHQLLVPSQWLCNVETLSLLCWTGSFVCHLSNQAKDWMAKKRWSVQFLSSPLSFLRSCVCWAEWNMVWREELCSYFIYAALVAWAQWRLSCAVVARLVPSQAVNWLTRGNIWIAPSFPIPVVYADAAVKQLWWSSIYSTYRYALTRICFFVIYQLDRLFAFSSLTPIISTLTGLHTVSAHLGLEILRRKTTLIPFQIHAVFLGLNLQHMLWWYTDLWCLFFPP